MREKEDNIKILYDRYMSTDFQRKRQETVDIPYKSGNSFFHNVMNKLSACSSADD